MSEWVEVLTKCDDLSALGGELLDVVPGHVSQEYDEDGQLTGSVSLKVDKISTRSLNNKSVSLLYVPRASIEEIEVDGEIQKGWLLLTPLRILSIGLTGTPDCPYRKLDDEGLAELAEVVPDPGDGVWPFLGGFAK